MVMPSGLFAGWLIFIDEKPVLQCSQNSQIPEEGLKIALNHIYILLIITYP